MTPRFQNCPANPGTLLTRATTLALALTAVSCHEPKQEQLATSAPASASADQVVARVNGEPILTADLAFQLKSGEDKHAALRSLIQAELLAQEAARRGLDRDPEVLRTRRRAMAHVLVRNKYGDRFTPADIPREMVEHAYKLNKIRFVHPEMVTVSHILAILPKSAPAEQERQARALAEKVHQVALSRAPLDEAAFKALAKELQGENPEIKLKAESLTTPRRNFTVAEFADAAFALSRPGAISPVVKSSYGFHVIYLKKRLPAENRSLADAEDEIRQRIFKDAQRDLFLRWVDSLEQKQGASLDKQALERSLTSSPES